MWCSNNNATAKKISLLFRTQILVIMHHLQLLYLRCGLSAKVWRDEWRCRWRIQCCVWSPRRELTSLAVKPEQVWRQAGTIRRRRPRVFLCFRCNSSHVGSLHTLADQSLSTVDQCRKVVGKLMRNLKHLSDDTGGFSSLKKKSTRFVFCFSQRHARVHLHIFYARFTFLLWGVTPGCAERTMNQAEENVF